MSKNKLPYSYQNREWVYEVYQEGATITFKVFLGEEYIGYCDAIWHTRETCLKYFRRVPEYYVVKEKFKPGFKQFCVMEVSLIKIFDDYRRRGAGTALLTFICEYFKRKGARFSFLFIQRPQIDKTILANFYSGVKYKRASLASNFLIRDL